MKKFFLAAAAVLMTMPAFSAKWAVVGAYTDPGWNFEASTVLEGDGDVVSATIAELTPSFKIVDIEKNTWDIQLGTATPVVIGDPVVLTLKDGGPDPANIVFANNVQIAKNAKVSFNTKDYTLLIESDDLVIELPTLYVTGSFCDWNSPGEGKSVLAEHTADGIYTAVIDLGAADKTIFKLAGKGWSNEIAGGVEITDDAAAAVTMGGDNLFTTLKGEQTLTFDINKMLMTFGDPSLFDTTGVADVELDENAAVEYFNLQGIRVANPENGLFIVKRGKKVSKVIVR